MNNAIDPIMKQAPWGIIVARSLLIVMTMLLAPLSLYLVSDTAIAQDQETNERANFWRAVRQGNQGYSAVVGQETNVLIQNGGENWRVLRNGPVVFYGKWILAGMLAAIILFFVIFRRVKIHNGRSGTTIQRWTMFERVLHWYTAILFIILALTGLSLLYGRELLIPLLGKDAFAVYAGFAKDFHNYLGPFFAAGLLIEIVKWIIHNIPRWHDVVWFFKGGGMIGKIHPHAGRMNGGEKVWFWLLATVGVALVLSGFVLDFPNYGQTRSDMQLAHLIHVAAGVVLIAVAMGHIYIGTLGTEGALEGMVTGRVDTEWAKQHHDLWYEDRIAKGEQPQRMPQTAPANAEPRST